MVQLNHAAVADTFHRVETLAGMLSVYTTDPAAYILLYLYLQ